MAYEGIEAVEAAESFHPELFVPGFFPITGSYPSQQGLGFIVLVFFFFVVFFSAISVLYSKKMLVDLLFINPSESRTIFDPQRVD